jgi:hypothetical protein
MFPGKAEDQSFGRKSNTEPFWFLYKSFTFKLYHSEYKFTKGVK